MSQVKCTQSIEVHSYRSPDYFCITFLFRLCRPLLCTQALCLSYCFRALLISFSLQYTKELLSPCSLVNFQTAYKMTSQRSWLDVRTRKNNLSTTVFMDTVKAVKMAVIYQTLNDGIIQKFQLLQINCVIFCFISYSKMSFNFISRFNNYFDKYSEGALTLIFGTTALLGHFFEV